MFISTSESQLFAQDSYFKLQAGPVIHLTVNHVDNSRQGLEDLLTFVTSEAALRAYNKAASWLRLSSPPSGGQTEWKVKPHPGGEAQL